MVVIDGCLSTDVFGLCSVWNFCLEVVLSALVLLRALLLMSGVATSGLVDLVFIFDGRGSVVNGSNLLTACLFVLPQHLGA